MHGTPQSSPDPDWHPPDAPQCNDGVWKSVPNGDPAKDQLKTVFENGELKIEHSYTDIRARAEVGDTPPVEPFVSSEPWVREFDAWAKETLGDKAPPSKAHLWQPDTGPSSVQGVLGSLTDKVTDTMTKEELVGALTALNALNSKLLQAAKAHAPAPV